MQLAQSLVKAISEGEIIYMHCWGGTPKEATVILRR